jgi:hypothetical protein
METLETKTTIQRLPVSPTLMMLEILPKTWVEVKRIRLEGPATLTEVKLGRIYYEPGNGLDAEGNFEPAPPAPPGQQSPLHVGPGRLVQIFFRPTETGEVRALLDVEPAPELE